MIRFIDTLKEEFLEKDIFVFDTGKRAIWLFSQLIFRGISISGFVTMRNEYAGDTILGKKIILLKEFDKIPNAIVVYDLEVDSITTGKLKKTGKGYQLSEVLALNQELFNGSHYLYGTGNGAMELFKKLSSNNILIKGFLETEEGSLKTIGGLPCIVFSEKTFESGDSIIISVKNEGDACEILDYLQSNGFCGDVYIRNIVSPLFWWTRSLFYMLDHAMKKDKKVLLCCDDEMSRDWFHEMFSLLGINIDREVCFSGDTNRELQDIYSLADEDPAKSVLILHSLTDSKRYEQTEAAKELGFTESSGNCASVHYICYSEQHMKRQFFYEKDNTLEQSVDYTYAGGKPGWYLYGKDEDKSLRVMVLGGSTSTEHFNQETWVRKLYFKIRGLGIPIVIFNGAHEGEDVTKELRRMIRDIDYLKPDIVISMSGVNNLGSSKNPFDCLREESALAYWKRIEQKIAVLAQASNAKMHVFLQPINMCMPNMTLEEGMLFAHQAYTTVYFDELYKESLQKDIYINLIDLFHHKEGMFIDCVHYSEAGNEKIAEKVFDEIIQEVYEVCKKKSILLA